MGLPNAGRRKAGLEHLGDPALDHHRVDPIEAKVSESGEEPNSEKRLIAGPGLGLEVRAGPEPLNRPVTKASCASIRIDPLSPLLLALDVDQKLLGVDSPRKDLGAFASGGIDVANLPLGRVDRMTADVGQGSELLSHPLGQPNLNVIPSEAEMLSHSKSLRAATSMSPRIDGLHRDV